VLEGGPWPEGDAPYGRVVSRWLVK
jgi:hypothetical protein